MPGRASTIVLGVLIVAGVFLLVSRRAAAPDDTPAPPRTGSRAMPVRAESPRPGTDSGPPSKSGSRTPRAERKTTTTASGLQYEILVEGAGPRPGPTDLVQVHYHGTTLDGTVFDSTIDRGKPVTFPLDRVIKGWTEGLQLMPVGAKYKFTIPSDLAYGSAGAGDKIGPGETLVFEIELLEIPPKP